MNVETSFKLLTRIRANQFGRSVGLLVSGTSIAQGIPILFTPIISRMFTPEDFAVLGLFVAFIGAASTIIGLSFPLAIVSAATPKTSAILVRLSLFSIIPVGCTVTFCLWLMKRYDWLGYGQLPTSAIFCGFFTLSLVGGFTTLRYWNVQEQQFGLISKATVSQSVGRVTAQIVGGIGQFGGIGLVVSEFVGRCSGVVALSRKSWPNIRELTSDSTMADYVQTAKEYRKFPLLSTPSNLFNSLALSLPVPLLTSVYGLREAGQFSMAYRVLALPLAVIGAAIADVFHGHLAKLAVSDIRKARRLFLQVAFALFCTGIIPSIIVGIWGEGLFGLVLGEQWTQSGALASGIMPWLFASLVVSPLSRVVLVFQGQEKKLIYDILATSGIVGCIMIGHSMGWSIVETATVLGVTQSIAYAVYFYLLWRMMRHA